MQKVLNDTVEEAKQKVSKVSEIEFVPDAVVRGENAIID